MPAIVFEVAERVGFEPTVGFYPHNRLAGGCLKPLGHLSRVKTKLYNITETDQEGQT